MIHRIPIGKNYRPTLLFIEFKHYPLPNYEAKIVTRKIGFVNLCKGRRALNSNYSFFQYVLEKCVHRGTFKIVAHSFGSLIAIELARRLESHGLHGELILIDGTPDLVKAMMTQGKPVSNGDSLQNRTLLNILKYVTPLDNKVHS